MSYIYISSWFSNQYVFPLVFMKDKREGKYTHHFDHSPKFCTDQLRDTLQSSYKIAPVYMVNMDKLVKPNRKQEILL